MLNRDSFPLDDLVKVPRLPCPSSLIPGDAVRLASGGPVMIITELLACDRVLCEVEEGDELCSHIFFRACLVKVK